MPLPSSGIIVVEKPSAASSTRINNSTTTIKTVNNNNSSSIHPPQERTAQQQTQIQYYEYYDVNENQQISQQKQQQQHQQYHNKQQHSTIVVDGTVYHHHQQQLQQQLQLGGSGGVAIGRKIHNSSSTSSTSSSTSLSYSTSSASTSTLYKPNLHIQTIKTVPMPQTKQQQQIIQHTSHTASNAIVTDTTATTINPSQHYQQPQHVQQINLAASSIHHHQQQATNHHTQQQQPTSTTTHMIQVTEEFLEQAAANTHNTGGNMMISTTGEVINQQQIFKIVSSDGTTGNMIIDATNNQNVNTSATTTSKVLLSNLTVLSKQQAVTAQGQIIASSNQHQQQAQTAGQQTINFVNAKNLYTTSTTGGNISAGGGKQQKFTVATANVGTYKSTAIKHTSAATAVANTQYLQQTNAIQQQQKINMTAGNRNMQMLTTTATRLQNVTSNSNSNNSNNVAIISNNAGAAAQTMVLQQQPQKFLANTTAGAKSTTATILGSAGGNVIKKSTTLRMNNSNNTVATTKLMNNLQTTQGVKTFITQNPSLQQQQTQQNQINQLTLQHHNTGKGGGGSKSKFVKQYNNAILNSAGAVAIATLPQQPANSQNNLQTQQQQQQQQLQQTQTTYINHHKSSGGSTKINKINSKYAQSSSVAAQLPPGTQLHQKSINQTQQHQQQHQFQTNSSSNSNIKFVNAQGTIIQQQQQQQSQQHSLTPQKVNNKHHHHHHQQQQQYQNLQNFDTVDGNQVFYNQTTAANSAISSSSSSLGTATASTSSSSSLLTDDIMMVNGTQMTDELSARILQSMSQKSFSNQRYQQQQQQQQHVFQTKTSLTTPSSASGTSLSSNNNCKSNSSNNMLPPPPTVTQNNSNILLSPREYTLYPTTASNVAVVSQQQQQSSPNHYNNSTVPAATTASSNITAGSFSSNNYITVSNNTNNMTTITAHTSGGAAANGSGGLTSSVRQAQSAPTSRSQSMERKLHESSMSRKSTEYYKVNSIKDYHSGCAFVVPKTATIYATNNISPSATSLIDFIIPLPSCTTITTTTTNNITTFTTSATTNCATMTTIKTNSSYNHNLNQTNNNNNNTNSNHNSLRGSHHNNLVAAPAAVAGQSGVGLGMASGNMSASASNLMGVGGVVSTATPLSPSPLPMPRPPSIPPAALIMEPQAQVIHLQATKTLPGANNSSNDDDDIIGEEIRPAPVETEDIRLRILHAVLFDHTYVNPMPLELPTSFAWKLLSASNPNATALSTAPSAGATGYTQQWSLGGIGAVASASVSGGSAQQNYALYGTQLSRHDDDSYSANSTSSRQAVGDIDPGEETETAPEAELEDDSITRCICDLTHDDGYMICCDKCCAWQHVDCMGIDRQNIPDEYLCELCQPRAVDKARARSLQLMKRKEQQQQQLMLTAQAQAAASAGTMGAAGSASGVSVGGGVANVFPNDVLGAQQRLATVTGAGFSLSSNMAADTASMKMLATGGTNLKKGAKMLKKVKDGVSGKKSKKAEKLAAAAVSGLSNSGKPARKETKKNTKRKKAGAHEGGGSTVGLTAAEKHAANLRQWIENYELAVTNHYSPELRARLHAITKQSSLLQSILNTENPILKEFSTGSLENRATTVPHAGGKILISNLDITPNSPICELRGKYMLTTQYKTQNTSMNMNSPPPNNYHLASYKAHKTPGPFIFFYQLPGTEVAASSNHQLMPQTTTTTTLNPDGTYTTTTTTLPAQQSPPIFLKGPEICVDTRTYGNEARFVRRSCRPNAEIQHLFEKGTIHLFIVALTDIRASTEITIRHEPHDLLAVDSKKSSTTIIQPTSTPCACGLTKDCIFGPPLPQLPSATKSNAGRKSLAHGGGASNAGNLTAKQRKSNQQNLNRNRSISSSASGDSNMGGGNITTTTTTVAMGLNSPNNVGKLTTSNKIVNNNNLMPLIASCNSNFSNASSSPSTLTNMILDSGICTSSSSPSVSIPSPTQHMHSPIQQQQQVQQQQLLHNSQMRPTAAQLLPQQQQQKLMKSLPTPLVLATTSASIDVAHQQQQQPVLQQPAMIIQQQQQQQSPLSVIAQTTTLNNSGQDVSAEQQQPQATLCLTTQPASVQQTLLPPPPLVQTQHQLQQQIILQEQQQQQQMQTSRQQTTTTAVVSQSTSGLLETVSPEATIAAVALQSLNASHSPKVTNAVPSPAALCLNAEPQQIQQQQFVLIPATEVSGEPLHQTQTVDNMVASTSLSTSATSSTSSPRQQQQNKSPQKNYHSQYNSTHSGGRKTPGKHARTTSFSEDNELQHHNEDSSVTSTPTSSSTPKEKPKLSREDRKMEAILKAIEKMERNQQRKLEQKQPKRQNASSHNTTPTSPNKTFDSGENSEGKKRTNSHTAGRSKKKRKAGAKGQGGGYNNQRKRRQSRMNSQESVDECSTHDHEAITSESDGCAAMHSPPIQTMASQRQIHFLTPTSTSASTTARLSSDAITNNVDQAAGLLMAFANPTISPATNSSTTSAVIPRDNEQENIEQSPQRSSTAHYMLHSNETASTSAPPTPPSNVSSACLLIEAAVGPLESNLEGNTAEINNSEFKYPLQAKTKKHLMNNWLHQAEENIPENNVASTLNEQTAQSIDSRATSMACSGDLHVTPLVSGGLDSLLQAAMSDLKQAQTAVTEEPQNLSIAAQKVEEFIQQSEASAGSSALSTLTQTKHSYEYEQQGQQHRPYVSMPTPAVDLSLKTPLTIGPYPNPPAPPSTEVTSNRNFHLPLQVSTCSNNSSVKKRWLRQAISEETHEEIQNSFSMTPSPTTAVLNSNFANTQQQPVALCSLATAVTNHVPNGFTTPLKKRRLLLTGKDEMEENLSQSYADLSTNATPSQPPQFPAQASAPEQSEHHNQMEYSHLNQNQSTLEEFDNKDESQQPSSEDLHEDVDVDVEKCEQHPEERPQNVQYSKLEIEQDVDVTTFPQQEVVHVEDQIKMENVIKYEDTVLKNVVKEESPETTNQKTEQTGPAEFNDQEDDVDILRSPSPGREMIKAEDNLVKIEPEDTSGTEDVKIDVEREESMAADDLVVAHEHKHRKEELITPPQVFKQEREMYGTNSSESVENKQEFEAEIIKKENASAKQEQNLTVVVETKNESEVEIKTEKKSHKEVREPKPERLNFKKSEADEQKFVDVVKKQPTKQESLKVNVVTVKQELKIKIETHSIVCQKEDILPHSTANTKENDKIKTENNKMESPTTLTAEMAEVTSLTSTKLLAVRTVATDTTFAGVDAATTPPPPVTTMLGGTAAAPIQRHKSLSDDDIQARLHSFHKENILFLQSRNKKSKSSASANANSNSSTTNCLNTSNDHHKNRTSSSSSSTAQHQHHHHHHDEGKEKSEKSSSKHHKSSSSSTSTTPSGGGSSKKQKLHKRERTTSTSSSNSHKNSSTSQISSSSSSSSLLNKNAVINSTTNSSGSSKKLKKSLKKSSSGSSNSSSTSSSSSSYSSTTLAPQNCYPSSTSTTVTANSNSDKDKLKRQRTTSSCSSSNNNIANCNTHNTSTTPYASSKKRQLNFELELTKDMHLVNSAISGGSKHKREASRSINDEQAHVAAKKPRKETSMSQKNEELKNGTNKQLAKLEKQQDKKSSNSLQATSSSTKASVAASSQSVTSMVTNTTPPEEPKHIPTIVTQSPPSVVAAAQLPLPAPTPILREHSSLPHFNNVVIATNSSLENHQQPPLPPVLAENIPNHVNSPSFMPSVYNNQQQQQQQQPPLPPTPPSGGISSPSFSTPSVSTTNHLPFYNTIYGKLLDNPTPPPSLPAPMTPSNISAPSSTPPSPMTTATTAVPSGCGSVLSEYLDTKLKSYNTLGGYVSHTALFGLNNAANIKDSTSTAAAVSSTTLGASPAAAMTTSLKDSSTEMPAPLVPPPAVTGSSTTSSGSAVTNTPPLKILTKTASHDPRLNPQLTAPEPPPQPKRKLSINEYRKRMQQSSSSNDSNSGSTSLTTTPTTPPTSLDTTLSSSLLAPTTTPITNKCTLNSPERLTQSVDSQIQKEIMSSTAAVTSSSSLDSLNSSNSSTSSNSLNDSLLKSSSFVEEDSTKGQFNAAPTLLEKQQESLCARLKSLKEKQSLGTTFSVGSGNHACFSSFSESVASTDFGLRKDDDDLDFIRNRNHSISSSIGGGDLLDNCLEEISSTSTSMSSSREPSPERCFTTHHKILTASATTTMTNTSATSHSNNGQNTRHHQQHHHHSHTHHQQQQHINCDKNEIAGLERKKSVDIA